MFDDVVACCLQCVVCWLNVVVCVCCLLGGGGCVLVCCVLCVGVCGLLCVAKRILSKVFGIVVWRCLLLCVGL